MEDNRNIAFIAFLDQDNLGVGYLASVLLAENYKVKIIDFRLGKERILEELLAIDPKVIGFSIIFQYHIREFKSLIDFLRNHGIDCHFTAGGHFPSLRYAELLRYIPDLDSIVLFEGEYTFLELANHITAGNNWKQTKGIAYREDGVPVQNDLRPLEEDLDKFPLPVRQPLREYLLGRKYSTLLAGRGCLYNCSFCSIREFYSKPPGALKRIRDPEYVVKEIELLHDELGCSIFMFQDDDFPGGSKAGKVWVEKFCEALEKRHLSKEILWKINCRSNEVDEALFSRMKQCGLFLVYLGIEDGTDAGLKLMNKRLSTSDNFEAVEILKRLDIQYEFGFMLFHPDSNFSSVLENIRFLEELTYDGSAPVTFCKMLPYAETQIEKRLIKEGRIRGTQGFETYVLQNPDLEDFSIFLGKCYENWMGRPDGLLNKARWAKCYQPVYFRYYSPDSQVQRFHESVKGVVAESNRFFCASTRDMLSLFKEHHENVALESSDIKREIAQRHREYKKKLDELIADFPLMR
jgi:radical SAM superfamily enzyme YgiQ (UPF0313 family)